jgi:pre-mRNA-splicing helicase BRR2
VALYIADELHLLGGTEGPTLEIVGMYVYMYINISCICIYLYIFIYIYLYICMYIYIYIYVYVVSRARYVASQLDRKVRIVGLSSSLANAKDAGDWLGAPQHSIYNFAPDVRPVPLEVYIYTYVYMFTYLNMYLCRYMYINTYI